MPALTNRTLQLRTLRSIALDLTPKGASSRPKVESGVQNAPGKCSNCLCVTLNNTSHYRTNGLSINQSTRLFQTTRSIILVIQKKKKRKKEKLRKLLTT